MAAHTTVADYTAALPDGLRATARALVAVVEEALPGAGEMAQVRLRSPGDVDAALFSDWLSRARALGG
jgi:hypothetical protein